MLTPRVDIAVIADAGGALSVPATFSVLFPAHQARSYRRAADGRRLLDTLNYARPSDPQDYADPVIWPSAPWADRLLRDTDGRIEAIERTSAEGGPILLRATPDGWQVSNRERTHVAQTATGGVLELRITP